MTKITSPERLREIKAAYERGQAAYERRVLVCGGAGCVSCHCQEVREALEESGLPAECMGVELTESGYLDSGGHFRKVWQGLKALGVKVLLDDFGTRYSNFHCLGDLTPNGLKIDRSFTRKALADSYEFNLLAQMIQMSKRLGIYVCIEGIETQEELERILMLEPDRIQGYYFSRPLPEELFRKKFIRQKEMSGNA